MYPKFWEKVNKTKTCWLWTGARRGYKKRYGAFNLNGKIVQAHRFSYSLLNNIPNGLEIDHKCRVTLCVNPSHLEAVPHKENCFRGRLKTCQNGHSKHWKERPDGGRICMKCNRNRIRTKYKLAKELDQ